MIFESTDIRVTAEHGTATLWLDFPGEPVNALDLDRLRSIDAAIAAVEASPFIQVLVVRSAKPAGFCAGLHPRAVLSLANQADRAAFAWVGQQVFQRLANLRAATIAFIDGPCLGAGLELALACDHRLCLCRPTTHLGFPDAPAGIVPGFGGSVRLRARIGRRAAHELLTSEMTLSGREARAIGLVDHAFCERRGKIELRTFLDVIERRGPRSKRSPECEGFAEERRHFAASLAAVSARAAARRHLARLQPPRLFPAAINPVPPFPAAVGLVGDNPFASDLAATAAMHGHRVAVLGSGARVFAAIAAAQARGFLTPLEAEQARGRVMQTNSTEALAEAGVVFAAPAESIDELADVLNSTCLLVLCGGDAPDDFPSPRRVIGMQTSGNQVSIDRFAETDSDAVAALAVWLNQMAPAFILSIREASVPAATRELAAA
jgi:enoyl-CoA hydratase/carnithine racemase